MSGITRYHNPACDTSRDTLAMIRNSGQEPAIVACLKTPHQPDLIDWFSPATPVGAVF
jgi:arsenate reductase-like glutaredoxin family protein